MKKLLVVGFSVLLAKTGLADTTQSSRYTMIKHDISIEQTDLLAQVRQLRFPEYIKTIGEAIEHLLENSGYALVEQGKRDQYQETLLSQPLPLIHRQLEPISLRKGLCLLAGTAYELIEDPIARTVHFKIKAEHQTSGYLIEDIKNHEEFIKKMSN